MTETKKLKFQLLNKFQPCFSSTHPVFFTERDSIVCGRSVDESIQISCLDATSFEKLQTFSDDDKVTSFVVDRDGSSLFISTKNLIIKRLELPSLKKLKIWQSGHQRPVLRMAVNKDCSRLVTASGDTVLRLWHLGPKEGYSASCRGHNSITSMLCFHPHEPYFFSSAIGDYNVAVWNAETGAKVVSLEGHQSMVMDLCFDRRGHLFVTCGRDKVFILWTCPEFTRLNVVPTFESLEAGLFLPVGALTNHLGDSVGSKELLLTGGQWGCLRVWDPQIGRCLLEIKGPLDRCVPSLSGSSSVQDRQLIEYGLHSIVSLQIANSHSELDFLLALVRQSNHIELYDPMRAKLLSECLGDIGQVDQLCVVGKSHNHLLLADASPHLKLFPRPYGLAGRATYDGSWLCYLVPGGHSDVVTDLVGSSCGEWVCSGSKDQSICLWRVVEMESLDKCTEFSSKHITVKMSLMKQLSSAHTAHVSALCFNRSTTLLFSASEDNILKAWAVKLPSTEDSTVSLSEWSAVHAAHKSSINDIDVSVNNQLTATASRDKTVKIWKIGKHTMECLGVLQGHRRGVWSVRFSTREKVVLTSSGDGDIKLWNLKDFSCIRTFEGHEQPVYKAVFLSNDRQILSCDQRGLVRLWDVGNPSANVTNADRKSDPDSSRVLEAHDGRIWSLALCPDESGFYTGGEDETLCYFRDITEEARLETAKKQEEFIQTNQLLNNLVESKQFTAALRLSIKLDQPKRTLDLLQDLILSEPINSKSRCTGESTSILESALHNLVSSHCNDGESNEVIVQRLLGYVVNWNTRARTSTIAQRVLNWILKSWPPEQLLKWPNFARSVESLIPYTDRHYQRLSRLEERLAVLDYLCDLADEHQVMQVPESTDARSPDNIVDLNLSMETES